MLGLKNCVSNLGYDNTATRKFISENQQIEIILKKDFVSRPFVFYKGKKVFSYVGPGFMESVIWEIEFIDDNTILLSSTQMDLYYIIELD